MKCHHTFHYSFSHSIFDNNVLAAIVSQHIHCTAVRRSRKVTLGMNKGSLEWINGRTISFLQQPRRDYVWEECAFVFCFKMDDNVKRMTSYPEGDLGDIAYETRQWRMSSFCICVYLLCMRDRATFQRRGLC